jgi:hypothetical protein
MSINSSGSLPILVLAPEKVDIMLANYPCVLFNIPGAGF